MGLAAALSEWDSFICWRLTVLSVIVTAPDGYVSLSHVMVAAGRMGREVVPMAVAWSTGLNPAQTSTKSLTFPGVGIFICEEG